jgi:cell division septal protein FtsQ
MDTLATVGQSHAVLPGIRQLLAARRAKIVAGILVLLLAAALFQFFNSDWFYVYDLDIAGTHYLTRGEIERASGVIGYNIFFVDNLSIERALTRLPEVKSARVTSGLPSRVAVVVEERQPVLAWLRGNQVYWVDAEGIIYGARANLASLPTIRDLDQNAVQPGAPALPIALSAYVALRSAMPNPPRAYEWSAARGLTFTDERGWKIHLGDANGMPGKIATYHALVERLARQNAHIRFIDLGKGDPYFQ